MGLVTREGVTKTQHAWDVDDGMTALPIYDSPNNAWRTDHNRSDVEKVDYHRGSDISSDLSSKKIDDYIIPSITEGDTSFKDPFEKNNIQWGFDFTSVKQSKFGGFLKKHGLKSLGDATVYGKKTHMWANSETGLMLLSGGKIHEGNDVLYLSYLRFEIPPKNKKYLMSALRDLRGSRRLKKTDIENENGIGGGIAIFIKEEDPTGGFI